MPEIRKLLNRSFEKASFGGYKAADVDDFMAELATTLSQSGREATELKRKLEAAEKKLSDYESEEESLKSTLLKVQRLADKIKKEAEEKAEVTIRDANTMAEATIRDAKIKAENLIDGAQNDIEMRKDEAVRIKKEVSKFKHGVMRLYKAQLELINGIPSEEPANHYEQFKTTIQSKPQTEVDAQKPAVTVQASEQLTQKEESAKTIVENTDDTLKKPSEQPASKADTVVFATINDTCEFVLGVQGSKAVKAAKNDGAENKAKTSARSQKTATMPDKSQDTQSRKTEQAENEVAATDAPVPAVKLNLRYNEKTGEYEPFGVQPQDDILQSGKEKDGLKFGSDYNLRTDSFTDSDSGTGHRAPWRK